MKLTHFFTYFRSLGGVQSVLQRHLKNDPLRNIQSGFVIFFEPDDFASSQVRGLGLSWRSTIRSARRKFSQQLNLAQPGIAAYYNCWGLPFFADLDHASRRIGIAHTDWPGIERQLLAQKGLVDGLLCVSHRLVEIAQRCLPDLAKDRIEFLPCPISPFGIQEGRKPLANRPVVLGFCGRLVKEQKRVDRLPRLYRCLTDSGINFRFEIMGDGPGLAWLKRKLQNQTNVHFHGRLTGTHYWRALNKWDAIVFVSDYEGLPLSLLEALSLGVLPLYPRINSDGDCYAARLNPDFLYRTDDFHGVASAVKRLTERSEESLESLRAAARKLAAPHLGEAYEEVFSGFLQYVAQAPRVSQNVFLKRYFYWTDYWPFALLSRLYPQAYYRRNSG